MRNKTNQQLIDTNAFLWQYFQQ